MEHSGELVPYSSIARQIVLRHRNTVVVYDEDSKQLTTDNLNTGELTECPYCHRPFEAAVDHEDLADDADFISPEYFRRLQASRSDSHQPSQPPSPPWRLVEPRNPRSSQGRDDIVRSGTARPVEEPNRISSKSFSQGYFKAFFEEELELGRGGKGVVLLVKHVLDGVTLGRFACKRIPVGNDHQWLKDVLLEVTLLQEISHENLVSYRHVWLEDFQSGVFTPRTPHVFILQQYCNAGTLLDYVLSPQADTATGGPSLPGRRASLLPAHKRSAHRSRPLALEEIFSFFKDITSGLAHLHANGFIHRDLKPQNCLLHRIGNSVRVLVSDFGEMQGVSVRRSSNATGYTGTLSFAAPEVIYRDEHGMLGDFTVKSDVFSLGMVMFFMCFGRLPYRHANLNEDAKEDLDSLRDEVLGWRGLKSEKKERSHLPEKLYENLQLLLSRDPVQRLTTEEILRRLRGGPSFYEHSTTSPVDDRFPSADYGFRRDRSKSPDEPADLDPPTPTSPPSRPRRFSTSMPAALNLRHRIPKQSVTPTVADTAAVDDDRSATRPSAQPRMLMPPPQRSLLQRFVDFSRRPEAAATVKVLVFLGKLWTTISWCAPHLPAQKLLYPLVVAAALDLINVHEDARISVALVLAHAVVILAAQRSQVLCAP